MNLNNISIPNADLSCALLVNSNFNNANMNKATFTVLAELKSLQKVICIDIINISRKK